MGRRVRCYATGEYGTSETFIKIKDHYYKSQEVYDQMKHDQMVTKEIEEMILFDLLDYTSGQPFPSVMKKKLKELSFYKPEIVLMTLKEIKDSLLYMLGIKHFDTDYGRIAYIFGAIKNHINDVYRREKEAEKAKCIISTSSEIGELSEEINVMKNNVARTNKRDIRQFIREE